jgi:Flp pilus assembly protein TadD
LLLNESKKFKEAERILQKGLVINPGDPEIHYILTLVYIQINDIAKARQTGIQLKRLAPGNPDYQQLFKNLGI